MTTTSQCCCSFDVASPSSKLTSDYRWRLSLPASRAVRWIEVVLESACATSWNHIKQRPLLARKLNKTPTLPQPTIPTVQLGRDRYAQQSASKDNPKSYLNSIEITLAWNLTGSVNKTEIAIVCLFHRHSLHQLSTGFHQSIDFKLRFLFKRSTRHIIFFSEGELPLFPSH